MERLMNAYKVLVGTCATLLIAVLAALPIYSQSSTTRQIALAGTTSMQAKSAGSAGAQKPERVFTGVGGGLGKRTIAAGPGLPTPAASHTKAISNPELKLSSDGLTHRDQRLADDGNQFSFEPPDQGLCAGNGFVVESVNSAIHVYDTNDGNALSGVTSHNAFYGYQVAYNRATGEVGPSIADPSCYFDPDTQRWFHLAVTADRVGTTFAFSGRNHIFTSRRRTLRPSDIVDCREVGFAGAEGDRVKPKQQRLQQQPRESHPRGTRPHALPASARFIPSSITRTHSP